MARITHYLNIGFDDNKVLAQNGMLHLDVMTFNVGGAKDMQKLMNLKDENEGIPAA